MNKQITQDIKSIVLALILVLGVGYVYADWTPAPPNPPSGNVDAPINAGASKQYKTGSLQIDGAATTSMLNIGYKFAVPTGVSLFENLVTTGYSDFRGKVGIGITPNSSSPILDVVGNARFNGITTNSGGLNATHPPRASRVFTSSDDYGTAYWSDSVRVSSGIFGSLRVTGGTPLANKVLTATDDQGNTEWRSSTSNNIRTVTNYTATLWSPSRPDIGPSNINSPISGRTSANSICTLTGFDTGRNGCDSGIRAKVYLNGNQWYFSGENAGDCDEDGRAIMTYMCFDY
jgi:hypothetical protein